MQNKNNNFIHTPCKRFKKIFLKTFILVIMGIITFCIYLPSIDGPFIFDDYNNIKNNPVIRINEISIKNLLQAGFKGAISSRPVSMISFALNFYFNKYNVFFYHLINTIIHILTGIIFYFFIDATLKIKSISFNYNFHPSIYFIIAFIWLIHPIQTQSVSYIIQRMNSMASMFYILSMFLYVKARLSHSHFSKTLLFIGCIISAILSFGSKEISVTLPFFIFLYEWYFIQNLKPLSLKKIIWIFIPIVIFICTAMVIHPDGKSPLDLILSSYKTYNFNITQRLLTQLRVVVLYISLLVWPSPTRLNLDYDFIISNSLTDPITTLYSLIVIISLLFIAIYMAKKERLISFCILWFFGTLIVESSFIGLDLVFEHRLYLPSMFIIVIAVLVTLRFIRLQWLQVTIFTCIICLFCFWTYKRNIVWSDDILLWQDCVQKSPNNARAYHNLGFAFERQGHMQEAIKNYYKSIEIDPNYAEAHNNLGAALATLGKLEEASSHYIKALNIDPKHAQTYCNLGALLYKQKDIKSALSLYQKALQIDPNCSEAYINIGVVLSESNNFKQAIKYFQHALSINPNKAEIYNNIGVALYKQNLFDNAIKNFTKAVQLKPDYIEAYHNWGNVLIKTKQYTKGINMYMKGLAFDPNNADLYNNVGVAFAKSGNYKQAYNNFKKAFEINPDLIDAKNNMDLCLKLMKQ